MKAKIIFILYALTFSELRILTGERLSKPSAHRSSVIDKETLLNLGN